MKKLKIKLTKTDKKYLEKFVRTGTKKARSISRANILLLTDQGKNDKIISQATKTHRQKIWRTRKRYIDEGLEATLEEKPRSGQPKKYRDKHEAEIIALACTNSPKGYKRWSLELMTKELKKRKDMKTINKESIRLVLKKAKLNLG